MQTSYFFMISVFVIITIGIIMQFPIASSDSGDVTQLYPPRPDLTKISLSLNDTFQQISQNFTKDLHFRFFDANNNSTINNVTFFINATKDGKVLMHDLFYTSTGSMTLKFSPGNDVEKWIIGGTNEPTLGGWMSKNDTLHIQGPAFTEGTYHIHVEVLSLFYVNELVDQSNPPKFDSWWSVDDKGNISQHDNSIISFGSTIPSVKIKNESPLKQFKSGIALKDIKCAPDLQLIIKANSHSPACVKPDDVSKLVERGWADKPNSLQEKVDFANVCLGMNDACRHRYDVKNSDPFGITALIIYHPPDVCLNPPSHSIPSGLPSCPPNKFYLKINSNYTAYLMGYNICDGNSCATNNNLSLTLPLNTGLNPSYQMIGLPVNLPWKYGDTVEIQLYVSSTNDNKTATLVDLGNSPIVP